MSSARKNQFHDSFKRPGLTDGQSCPMFSSHSSPCFKMTGRSRAESDDWMMIFFCPTRFPRPPLYPRKEGKHHSRRRLDLKKLSTNCPPPSICPSPAAPFIVAPRFQRGCERRQNKNILAAKPASPWQRYRPTLPGPQKNPSLMSISLR